MGTMLKSISGNKYQIYKETGENMSCPAAALNQSKMYNFGNKEAFLQSVESGTARKLQVIFNNTSRTEALLGKDLYDFNEEEISSMFLELGMKDYGYIRAALYFIGLYMRWARQMGFSEGCEPEEICLKNIDISETLKMSCAQNPQELVEKLREVYPFDERCFTPLQPTAPIVFLLSWMGLSASEIWELENEAVNMEQGSITAGGETKPIPKLFLPYIKAYLTTTEFHNERGIAFRLADCGYVIRRAKFLSDPSLDTRVCKYYPTDCANNFPRLYSHATGKRVEYTSASTILAGKLYTLYQTEQEKGGLTEQDFIRVWKMVQNKDVAWKVEDKRLQYEMYKRAFSLN